MLAIFCELNLSVRPNHQVISITPKIKSKYILNDFYAPSLKSPPGASSNRIVRPSVPFACLSVILSRLQTKCNI